MRAESLLSADIGAHEAGGVRGFARRATTEVARGAFTEKLGEPSFVFDLFVQNCEREVVGAVILTNGEIANVGISSDRATLGLHQNSEQVVQRLSGRGLAARERIGQAGIRAASNVCKLPTVAGKLSSKFLDSRREGLEVVAILNSRVLDDLLQSLSLKSNGCDAKNRIVVEGRELRPRGGD